MISEETLNHSEGNEEIIVRNTYNNVPLSIDVELINLNFESTNSNTKNKNND